MNTATKINDCDIKVTRSEVDDKELVYLKKYERDGKYYLKCDKLLFTVEGDCFLEALNKFESRIKYIKEYCEKLQNSNLVFEQDEFEK